MSILTYNFQSEYLRSSQEITVIMPDRPWSMTSEAFFGQKKKYKVLWLLHGTFGDHTDWVRRTNIELYATEKDLVVVMPQMANSNYSNWEGSMLGYMAFDYLTRELMPLIYGWLPVSDKREDNFIAGLSMGGRGTMKYALNHPEKFAAAAVLSAAPMDLTEMRPGHPCGLLDTADPRIKNTLTNAGGLDAYIHSNENFWALFDELAPTGKLPRMMFACGTADTLLYEYQMKFKEHAKEIGLEAHWFELEGYKHEWRFWDLAIQEALKFFGL